MAKSGPETPQTAEVVSFGVDRRLRAPDSLGDSARRAFIEIVASHAASHFKPSDLTVLCRYAELVALAERSACELERDGVVLADGSLSKWFTVHSTVTKQIGVLAGRLRIGPSSRQHQQSRKTVQPMSFYDRMKLDKDWDKV
jgi:phage terminase small subunit